MRDRIKISETLINGDKIKTLENLSKNQVPQNAVIKVEGYTWSSPYKSISQIEEELKNKTDK